MRLNWQNILVLLRSDLRMSIRSKGILFILGMPLILSLVMGLVTRQAPVSSAKLAIIGERAGSFAQTLEAIKIGDIPAFEISEADEPAAMALLESGKLDGVLTLPEGTSDALRSGQTVQLRLAIDEASRSKGLMIQNFVREIGRAFSGIAEPVELQVTGTRGINTAQSMLPLWIVMVLLSGITLLPAALAHERQTKTLDALLVTPMSFLDIIIGRAAYGVVLGMAGSLIILLVHQGFAGNQLLVWLYIFLGALMSVLLGLLIGLAQKDLQAASMTASLAYVMLIWGVAFAELGGIISKIMSYTPSFRLASGIRNAMFTTAPLSEHVQSLAYPLGLALIALIGCVLLIRRQEA